jgi:hypothetical protein
MAIRALRVPSALLMGGAVAVLLPLAPAPALAGDGEGDPSAFAFIETGPDSLPARWNPCRTLTYKVHLGWELEQDKALSAAHAGIRRLEEETGLEFSYEGTTDYLPKQGTKPPVGVDVVIAFAHSGSGSLLDDVPATGIAQVSIRGGVYNSAGQPTLELVSAQVVVAHDGDYLMMHELAHAVGLAHVEAQDQVLNTGPQDAWPITQYGLGDRNGLQRVGGVYGCIYPTPPVAPVPTPGPSLIKTPRGAETPTPSVKPVPTPTSTPTPNAPSPRRSKGLGPLSRARQR